MPCPVGLRAFRQSRARTVPTAVPLSAAHGTEQPTQGCPGTSGRYPQPVCAAYLRNLFWLRNLSLRHKTGDKVLFIP